MIAILSIVLIPLPDHDLTDKWLTYIYTIAISSIDQLYLYLSFSYESYKYIIIFFYHNFSLSLKRIYLIHDYSLKHFNFLVEPITWLKINDLYFTDLRYI